MNKLNDQKWMKLAWLKSQESACKRTKVGCVLIYNPVGFKIQSDVVAHQEEATNGLECTDKTCLREEVKSGEAIDLCRGLHAEQRAIVAMGSDGCEDGIMYVTHLPCTFCARLIIAVGIKEVIFDRLWGNSSITLGIFAEAGVKVRCIHDGGTSK